MSTLDRLWRAARFTSSYADQLTDEESEEENFEEGLDFQEQEDESISGIRRRLSEEASVSRVGEALNQTLGADRVDTNPRDHFSPVQVRFPVNAPALRPPQAVMAFEDENAADGADALNKAIQGLRNFVYDPQDLKFTFQQLEIKMKAAGVRKNFTKLQTLTTILPKEVIDEIKNLLRKEETEFENNDAYKQAKHKILEIFGQADEEPFERAMSRVMSGKPSQLARGIVNDMCDREMVGCCCHKWVAGAWKRQLPSSVKQAIADTPFNHTNFSQILKTADKVFGSTRPSQAASVAAVDASADPALDEAFHPSMPWPQHPTEVAAYSQRGRGQGRGRGSGGRGQGRGGQQNGQQGGRGGGQNRGQGNRGNGGGRGQGGSRGSGHPRHKTQRHADLPPFESCFRHWTFGKSAHFCMEPASCPWKDHWVPKANN